MMTLSATRFAPETNSGRRAVDWAAALDEHRHWLQTVVYARVRDREVMDEVMQEVALAAVRQASPLNDPSKVAPWLYRLALRQVLLYRRRCGRRRRLAEDYVTRGAAREEDDVEADPLQWLLADERRSLIRVAIQRLGERDAEILLLKYTENWTYQQIAAHLGVSRGAVESRLHRARGRIRAELTVMNVLEATR